MSVKEKDDAISTPEVIKQVIDNQKPIDPESLIKPILEIPEIDQVIFLLEISKIEFKRGVDGWTFVPTKCTSKRKFSTKWFPWIL